MNLESERGLAAERLIQTGPWWEKAIMPILLSLTMILTGAWLTRQPSRR